MNYSIKEAYLNMYENINRTSLLVLKKFKDKLKKDKILTSTIQKNIIEIEKLLLNKDIDSIERLDIIAAKIEQIKIELGESYTDEIFELYKVIDFI